MVDIAATPSSSLYDRDFYAWTQAQSALLRRGRLGDAGTPNILEQIESLGRTQVAELHSHLRVLVHHLLKKIHQPEKANRSWATTIVAHRLELERHLRDNPSLEPKRLAVFAEAYADARKAAAVETGLPPTTLPTDPPFTCAQATDEDFWPGRSIDDRN